MSQDPFFEKLRGSLRRASLSLQLSVGCAMKRELRSKSACHDLPVLIMGGFEPPTFGL
jgi:hypothetical protein